MEQEVTVDAAGLAAGIENGSIRTTAATDDKKRSSVPPAFQNWYFRLNCMRRGL